MARAASAFDFPSLISAAPSAIARWTNSESRLTVFGCGFSTGFGDASGSGLAEAASCLTAGSRLTSAFAACFTGVDFFDFFVGAFLLVTMMVFSPELVNEAIRDLLRNGLESRDVLEQAEHCIGEFIELKA